VDFVSDPDQRRPAVADLAVGLGDELWAVIGWNSQPDDWTRERAAEAFEASLSYWRDWSANLKVDVAESSAVSLKRSAITVHLLSHAEHAAATAALTGICPRAVFGNSP
jgi:GH15 family glucan-1,4-alpha-glucosidase